MIRIVRAYVNGHLIWGCIPSVEEEEDNDGKEDPFVDVDELKAFEEDEQ